MRPIMNGRLMTWKKGLDGVRLKLMAHAALVRYCCFAGSAGTHCYRKIEIFRRPQGRDYLKGSGFPHYSCSASRRTCRGQQTVAADSAGGGTRGCWPRLLCCGVPPWLDLATHAYPGLRCCRSCDALSSGCPFRADGTGFVRMEPPIPGPRVEVGRPRSLRFVSGREWLCGRHSLPRPRRVGAFARAYE